MARSARDLRLLLSIIAKSPALAQPEPIELKGLKVALWLDEPGFTIDPEAKAVIVAFAEHLAAAGAVVEPITGPVPIVPMMFAYTTLFFAIIGTELQWPQWAFYDFLRGPAKIRPRHGRWAFVMGAMLSRADVASSRVAAGE